MEDYAIVFSAKRQDATAPLYTRQVLNTVPPQVLIEVKIVEITQADSAALGWRSPRATCAT